MNARDSEKLSGVLESKGYVEGTDEDSSDIVVFNTCTVRENANSRLYGRVGYLKKSCQINKHKIIGICGCMMQEADEIKTIREKYPYVKLIFGTHNIGEFSKLLDEVIEKNEKVIKVYSDASDIDEEDKMPSKRVYDFKCGVNIMYGCNNFCSYCIVPYVRGRERSRNAENIINEIKNDVNNGVVEVMLLGQNVNSYCGKQSVNSDEIINFPTLLSKVCEIDNLQRVRFMTSHPKDFSLHLIEVIKEYDNCCRHIHLPLQSGSDKILSLMNRHYDRKHYLNIIDKIKNEIDDVSITTDIIVGFPGETEEDFNDTIDILKKISFDSVFTFEYSKRQGTKAATMQNQIDQSVVKDRFKRLLQVVEECSNKNTDKYVGRVFDVLVESKDKEHGKMTGRLKNNYLVHFCGDESMIGKIINIKLIKSYGFYFEGEIWK